jgi:hypothetical protein
MSDFEQQNMNIYNRNVSWFDDFWRVENIEQLVCKPSGSYSQDKPTLPIVQISPSGSYWLRESAIYCSGCEIICKTDSEKELHEAKCPELGIHCDCCNTTFSTTTELAKHDNERCWIKYWARKSYCNCCGEYFDNQTDLDAHDENRCYQHEYYSMCEREQYEGGGYENPYDNEYDEEEGYRIWLEELQMEDEMDDAREHMENRKRKQDPNAKRASKKNMPTTGNTK